MENLVLAQDCALEATGDADEVACGGGVLESQPSRWQLGELAVTERLEGDIQLDAVAGVHDHHRVVALESVALGGERLARNAGDPSRVSDEGHDGGRRCIDNNRCQYGGRLRHGDHALPLVDAISAISVSCPLIKRHQQLVDGLGRSHKQVGGLGGVQSAASGHLGELAQEEHAEAKERLDRLADLGGSSGGDPAVLGGGVRGVPEGRLAVLRGRRVDELQQRSRDPAAMVAQRRRARPR